MKKLSLLLVLCLLANLLPVVAENTVEQNKVIEVARDLKKVAMYLTSTIGALYLVEICNQQELKFKAIAMNAFEVDFKIINGPLFYKAKDGLCYSAGVEASKFVSLSRFGSGVFSVACALCVLQSLSYIFSAVYKAVEKNSQKKEVLVSE